MHTEARKFLDWVRTEFASYFHGRVLDVGSGDINGNNRSYFPQDTCSYIGCDVVPGPNVDIVSPCHLLPFEENTFSLIISSECFEHDMHYEASLKKIERMLKPGGLFVFTCASHGRPEHGTLRTSVNDSFTTQLSDETWGNYYKNLEPSDIARALDLDNAWAHHEFHFNRYSQDLYFVGVKCLTWAATPFTDTHAIRINKNTQFIVMDEKVNNDVPCET